MSTVIVDKELIEAALLNLNQARNDIEAGDKVLNDYLAVIRAQAKQVDELKVLLDAQDAIIAKLRYGAKP